MVMPGLRSVVVRRHLPDMFELTFEDTGPGVDDPSMLFKPFRDNSDGSGIGLYVSRALVRGFGGELSHVPIASGCRFDISLRTYLMERRDA